MADADWIRLARSQVLQRSVCGLDFCFCQLCLQQCTNRLAQWKANRVTQGLIRMKSVEDHLDSLEASVSLGKSKLRPTECLTHQNLCRMVQDIEECTCSFVDAFCTTPDPGNFIYLFFSEDEFCSDGSNSASVESPKQTLQISEFEFLGSTPWIAGEDWEVSRLSFRKPSRKLTSVFWGSWTYRPSFRRRYKCSRKHSSAMC